MVAATAMSRKPRIAERRGAPDEAGGDPPVDARRLQNVARAEKRAEEHRNPPVDPGAEALAVERARADDHEREEREPGRLGVEQRLRDEAR